MASGWLRVLGLSTLVIVGAAGAGCATGGTKAAGGAAAVAPSDPQAKARWDAISAEMSSLNDHPWAGRYQAGDSAKATRDELVVSPQAGYVLTLYGRRGACSAGCPNCASGATTTVFGDVVPTRDGAIRLAYEPEAGNVVLVDELRPVRWGKRAYLIPIGKLEAFRRAVASGAEPRRTADGPFYLRGEDYKVRVTGLPEGVNSECGIRNAE